MPKFDTAAPISAVQARSAVTSGRMAGVAGPTAAGSFVRFVLFGGGVGVASSVAVPVMGTLMPWAVANALITVASTLLGTELHARFTFGGGRRARWDQHLQSAGSATAAYLVTSAAVFVLHAVQPSAGISWEQAVYLGASGLAGTGRFLVLRLYVFARGRTPGTGFDDVRLAAAAPAANARADVSGGPAELRAPAPDVRAGGIEQLLHPYRMEAIGGERVDPVQDQRPGRARGVGAGHLPAGGDRHEGPTALVDHRRRLAATGAPIS